MIMRCEECICSKEVMSDSHGSACQATCDIQSQRQHSEAIVSIYYDSPAAATFEQRRRTAEVRITI